MSVLFGFGISSDQISSNNLGSINAVQNLKVIHNPRSIAVEKKWASDWPIRDQFGRGTCVAFGVAAALEILLANELDLPPTRISEEFIDHRMHVAHPLTSKEKGTLPDGVRLLKQAMEVLQQDGYLESYQLPYKSLKSVSMVYREKENNLLDTARRNIVTCHDYARRAGSSLRDTRYDFDHDDTLAIRLHAHLEQGMPTVIGVPMFAHDSGYTNWTLPQTMSSGIVYCPDDAANPNLKDSRKDGHVVCLTGFVPDTSEPLGGWFIFKNSWGLEFGVNNGGFKKSKFPLRRGFGMLSATHVENYCWEYLVPRKSTI